MEQGGGRTREKETGVCNQPESLVTEGNSKTTKQERGIRSDHRKNNRIRNQRPYRNSGIFKTIAGG